MRSSSSLYYTLQCVHSLQSPGSPSKWQARGHPNQAPGHSGDNVHRMCTCTGVIAIAVPSVHSPTHRGLQLPPFYRCETEHKVTERTTLKKRRAAPYPEFAEVSYLGRGLLSWPRSPILAKVSYLAKQQRSLAGPGNPPKKLAVGLDPPELTWFLGERSKARKDPPQATHPWELGFKVPPWSLGSPGCDASTSSKNWQREHPHGKLKTVSTSPAHTEGFSVLPAPGNKHLHVGPHKMLKTTSRNEESDYANFMDGEMEA